MIREDYVMRLIRQLVEAIARIAGFRKRGEYERALKEVADAWEQLGVPRDLVVAVDDDATITSLLREPAKQRIAAELLAEEAHVMHAKGDPLNAARLRGRAIELFMRARATEPTDADDAAIAELGRYLPPAVLTELTARVTRSRAV